MTRIGSTLSLLTLLATTSAVAQQPGDDAPLHLPMISHEKLAYDGKVIYEADVDMADPKAKPFVLEITVDDLSRTCLSKVGSVSTDQYEQRSKIGITGYQISCVVTTLSPNGDAQADVVYTIQDPAKNASKSGHIKVNFQEGKEYKTLSNGSQVTLLLRTY
ncbi:hypothetical protein QVM55_12965 [Pseudomonas monteilii]|uniref:hypothetical protein n=1 Tax=Pseudomonas monteilii TaxID=76759 RepID=UPI003524D606